MTEGALVAVQEARRLLEARLPIPAYDHLLKLSHVFNVLDARGAVGVTERQACFATLRALARQVTGGGHQLGQTEAPSRRLPLPARTRATAGSLLSKPSSLKSALDIDAARARLLKRAEIGRGLAYRSWDHTIPVDDRAVA